MLTLLLTFEMYISLQIDNQWEKYIESILQTILSKIPYGTNINICDFSDSIQKIVYIKHLRTRKCIPHLKHTYSHMMSQEFKVCDENWRLDPWPSLSQCREYSMCRSGSVREITRYMACLTSEHPKCQISTTIVQNRVVYTTLQAAAQQECIQVEYGQDGDRKVKVNHHMLNQHSSEINVIKFSFQAHRLLGMNITFKTFSLSDMCFVSFPYKPEYLGELVRNKFQGSCHYVHGTEYVIVNFHVIDLKPIYYCFKRPQWSIYTKNIVTIEQLLCERCANFDSTIKFAYQVMNSGILLTYSDQFSRIIFGTIVKSSLCLLKQCSIPRQIIYIRGFQVSNDSVNFY